MQPSNRPTLRETEFAEDTKKYNLLTPENKQIVNALIERLRAGQSSSAR